MDTPPWDPRAPILVSSDGLMAPLHFHRNQLFNHFITISTYSSISQLLSSQVNHVPIFSSKKVRCFCPIFSFLFFVFRDPKKKNTAARPARPGPLRSGASVPDLPIWAQWCPRQGSQGGTRICWASSMTWPWETHFGSLEKAGTMMEIKIEIWFYGEFSMG